MQLGIDSFAASIPDPITGAALSAAERMQNLLEEITLADQVGQMGVSTMPHTKMMHAIEILGTRVAPMVREEVSVSAGTSQ